MITICLSPEMKQYLSLSYYSRLGEKSILSILSCEKGKQLLTLFVSSLLSSKNSKQSTHLSINLILNLDSTINLLQGTTTGAIFGDGTYFARDAKYSLDYACTLPSGKKQMLIAEVHTWKILI